MQSQDYSRMGIKVIVTYPQSEKECRRSETTPQQMASLFKVCNPWIGLFVKELSLELVNINVQINNWLGAGLDTDQPLILSWSETANRPVGQTGLYLGFPSDNDKERFNEVLIGSMIGHELAHVLTAAYLTKFMDCPLTVPKQFFVCFHLPLKCRPLETYVEMLCSAIPLAINQKLEQIYQRGEMGSIYDKDPGWARTFILSTAREIRVGLRGDPGTPLRGRSWKKTLFHLLESPKAKKSIEEAIQRLS